MKRAISMAATVAMLLGGAGQVRADLIVNGGFETGDFTGWSTTGPIEVLNGSAYQGNFEAVFTQSLSFVTLTQTLTTTPGADYTLDFHMLYSGTGDNTQEFKVLFGGTTVIDLTGAAFHPIQAQTYQDYNTTVTAVTASDALQFETTSALYFYRLDNVSVSGTSSVPEPSSFLLCSLPFGVAAFRAWRRRRLGAAA